jgi:hypothetical protein
MAWLSYLTALGPLVIGAFVAYVAFSQRQVARATCAEKLFDKRYRIVKAVLARTIPIPTAPQRRRAGFTPPSRVPRPGP